MVLSIERFSGKIAIVTGASAGIGAAIAEELVKNGIIVAGLARRVDRIEALAKKLSGEKGKLYAFKCDMTNEDEIVATIKQVTEKIGPISILVNNAGVGRKTSLMNGDTKAWKVVLDTNVLGLCIATREAIQNMKANNTEGHIIHINSITGHAVFDIPELNVYGASKYAVTNLAGTLRHDITREKLPIKITSISPGLVKSEIRVAGGYDEIVEVPILNGSDIADAAIYALSTPPHVNVNEIIVQAVGS